MIGTADEAYKKRLHRIQILYPIERLSQQRDIITANRLFGLLLWCVANENRLRILLHNLHTFVLEGYPQMSLEERPGSPRDMPVPCKTVTAGRRVRSPLNTALEILCLARRAPVAFPQLQGSG
jgi:hypothetical protein